MSEAWEPHDKNLRIVPVSTKRFYEYVDRVRLVCIRDLLFFYLFIYVYNCIYIEFVCCIYLYSYDFCNSALFLFKLALFSFTVSSSSLSVVFCVCSIHYIFLISISYALYENAKKSHFSVSSFSRIYRREAVYAKNQFSLLDDTQEKTRGG